MFSPQAPTHKDMESALAFVLATIEIPPRPAILDQVMAEMQSEEPDYRRLSTLIQNDVGLSAGLIKTANAPIFGYRNKASTIRDALTMLGLIMVLRTVASIALRQTLPESTTLKGFWDTSTRVAHLSAWLARQLGIHEGVRAQDAYTFGLFRDCGIPVMLKAFVGYEQTLAIAKAEPICSFTAMESAAHPLNHASVGAALARQWLLPESLALAILYHHDVAILKDSCHQVSPAACRLIALAQLAEHLQSKSERSTDHEWDKLGAACQATLELSATQLTELESGAADVLRQID